MLKLFLFLELLHHFGIAVANQGLDEIIFQRAIEVYLIPVFLIPMPCAFYFGMHFPEFEGVIGITFHRNQPCQGWGRGSESRFPLDYFL